MARGQLKPREFITVSGDATWSSDHGNCDQTVNGSRGSTSYEDLIAWQRAMELVDAIYE